MLARWPAGGAFTVTLSGATSPAYEVARALPGRTWRRRVTFSGSAVASLERRLGVAHWQASHHDASDYRRC
jgi:hypothetical protein